MPTIQVSTQTMALLVAEARELDIAVKDLADSLILLGLAEEFEDLEEEDFEEEDQEEEDFED